jgi:hypothetical protein
MPNRQRKNASGLDTAIFVRTMPTIEIVGDNVFIGTAKGMFALAISQYRALHRQGGAALAMHDAANGNNIAPACRMCSRPEH